MNLTNFTLLFCNGDPPDRDRLKRLVPAPASVVCADGGAQKALSTGYTPNLVVGDLDSLVAGDDRLSSTEILKVPTQENTDFEKTLDVILSRGMNDILVVAFSGGRIDQTLANVQTAFAYSKRCRIALADDDFLLLPVNDEIELRYPVGTTVSVVPMTDEAIVTTDGLAYELRESVMMKGGHGISNRSLKEDFKVTVRDGGILMLIKDA